MEFGFDNKNLEKLYTTGKSKKFPYPDYLIRKFAMRILSIEAATTIYDLRKPPSNNFEKMMGTKNQFSMRVQGKYRVVFDIDFEDEKKTYGMVNILGFNNRYGD